MQSSVWGGGEKSIKSNKTIKLPALARLILAAGWRKLRSCAMEAAAFRHPFLVSFLSVCCWWRREDTFPKQDICFDPCTAVLMYSAGSSSDLKKKKKKKQWENQKTTDTYLNNRLCACSSDKGRSVFCPEWEADVKHTLKVNSIMLLSMRSFCRDPWCSYWASWSLLQEKPVQQVRGHFLWKVLSFNFFQLDKK